MDTSMLPIAIAAFLTVSLLIVGIYFVVCDLAERKQQARASINGKLGSRSGSGGKSVPSKPQMEVAVTLEAATNSLATKPVETSNRWEAFSLWVEQSGMRLNPVTLIITSLVVGGVSAITIGVLLFNWWLPFVGFALTAWLPFAMVAFERYRRSDKIRSQLPDALDLMARMLRAGQTIPQALSGVADEFDAPIADEFGFCYEQQNLGLSTEAAMYEMARRTGVLELRILVVALTIHRQTGGNLSELLDSLAEVIRERYRIQGQIKSLTADGRMQAAILLALPPVLLIVLSVLNNEYVTILYQFPWLLLGMFGFELFGAIWLHKIVSFDF